MNQILPFLRLRFFAWATALVVLAGCSPAAVVVEATAPPPTVVAATAAPTAAPPTQTPAPTPSAVSAPPPPTPSPAAPQLPDSQLFNTLWTDRSVFRAGLVAAEQGTLAQLPGAPLYHLHLDIADDLLHLTGRQEVLVTNQETEPLPELYFRLFPNLAGGASTITGLTVNDRPVESVLELKNSVLRLPLPEPLQPGRQAVIGMSFNVDVPEGAGGNYGTFAYLDDVLALAHVYPMLAVYDDEGWNVELAPAIGDVIYADVSFFRVQVSAPAAVQMAATGREVERNAVNDRQVVTYAAGPARDFYLAASPAFSVTSRLVGETTVNSYAPVHLATGAAEALNQAAQALEIFNRQFGPYPYTEFDLVSTTTFALGIEYPGMVAILADLYAGNDGALLESVVAHEVAHQWFYNTVGNDQVDEPWLDEALAQYATLLYYEEIYGAPGVAGFRGSLERRWERVGRVNMPVGLPVRAYTAQEYGAIVYGRGPLFVVALAETMGAEPFAAFLADYYQTYRWGIATGSTFKALAQQHCGCDLTPLFEEWVNEPNQAP